MFNFLQPLFLYGMIGGIIPLIIHLFVKNQAKILKFSTIRYLQISYKNRSRKLKLKHWLLLLLRILIIVLFALILSKPILKIADSSPLFSAFEKNNVVIILDNSFSMGYTKQGVSSFAKAKEILNELLDTFKQGDKITILSTDKEPRSIAGPYATNLQAIREKLLQEKLSSGVGNVAEALLQGYKLLKEAKEAKKNIFLLSDMQEYSSSKLLERDSLKLIDPAIPLFFLEIKTDNSYKNVTVKEANLKVKGNEEGRLISISAELKDYSRNSSIEGTTLSLFINRNKVATRTLSQLDLSKQRCNLFCQVEGQEAIEGYLELSDDNLPLDNSYYFYVPPKTAIPILIIDGDSSHIEYLSETFFLKNALNPYGEHSENIPFIPTVTPVEYLDKQDMAKYEIVILANIESIEEQTAVLLDSYISRGGMLWIFVGDKVEAESYNYKMRQQRRYGGFLPGDLDRLTGDENNKEQFFYIDMQEKYNHKLFNFLSEPNMNIEEVKFYKCFEIKLDDDNVNIKVIASFSNGFPALVEKTYGEGKVMLFNFTCDAAWTNFPVKTSFLPFLHEVIHLNKKQEKGRAAYTVGDKLSFPLRFLRKAEEVEVITPSNERKKIEVIDVTRNNSFVYSNLDESGLYKVRAAGERIYDLAVNLEAEESDLTPIELKKLKDFWEGLTFNIISDFSNLEKDVRKVNEGQPLWDYLLFAVLFLLLAENFLANKMR